MWRAPTEHLTATTANVATTTNVATTIIKPIAYTHDSMLEAKALLSKTYHGWHACKLCTAEHILGQLAFNSLTARASNAWTQYNSGSKEPPTFERVIAFLDQYITNLDGDRCLPAVLTKAKAPPLVSKNLRMLSSTHSNQLTSLVVHNPVSSVKKDTKITSAQCSRHLTSTPTDNRRTPCRLAKTVCLLDTSQGCGGTATT